jgi:TfoX/Sxy family transcriptional regulator of competence genes
MSTTQDFIEYVVSQIRTVLPVRYRKMFGDYMVYVNEKPVLLVCDNMVYVKKLPELADLMVDAEVGCPYDGAKEHYFLDIENPDQVSEAIQILERLTPVPKPKKNK